MGDGGGRGGAGGRQRMGGRGGAGWEAALGGRVGGADLRVGRGWLGDGENFGTSALGQKRATAPRQTKTLIFFGAWANSITDALGVNK
jgi:hypothetical protein